MDWDKLLVIYDKLIEMTPGIERKGKNLVYTSDNGHMFSQLNKAGQLGIRLSKESGEKFMREFNTGEFRSYGAVMREYVLVPEKMLEDLELLSGYLKESHNYVLSLPPKSTKK